MSELTADALRVMAIDKVIRMSRTELCKMLDLPIPTDIESRLVENFKAWVSCKGYFHVAKELGHGTTRFVQRWHKEERLPKKDHARILRIMKQEGMIE